MNRNEQIQHVEISLEEAKRIAEFSEAIARLEKNADFRKVILDGYFTEEARRLTFLTADTTLDDKLANATLYGIRAIGELRSFLLARKAQGEVARKEIADFNETLDELRHEDAEEA